VTSLVRLEHPAPHVAEIVLDRPEALNALSTALAKELTEIAAGAASDNDVRAVVLSSATAAAFCVGADLKERAAFSDAELADQRPRFRAAFESVLGIPVPTVAAVHGPALGGGFEFALCCDLIVADTSALLGLPEVGVGLVPGGGGTQLLPRRVGLSRAADLLFTARRVEAEEAYRLGVVDRLVAPGTDRETALALAADIARNAPVALRAAKAALRGGLGLNLAAALNVEDVWWRRAAFSADRKEGIAAFVEKRPPRWQSA
jgi:enoyl-CoA hydratase/carnithine racemase